MMTLVKRWSNMDLLFFFVTVLRYSLLPAGVFACYCSYYDDLACHWSVLNSGILPNVFGIGVFYCLNLPTYCNRIGGIIR